MRYVVYLKDLEENKTTLSYNLNTDLDYVKHWVEFIEKSTNNKGNLPFSGYTLAFTSNINKINEVRDSINLIVDEVNDILNLNGKLKIFKILSSEKSEMIKQLNNLHCYFEYLLSRVTNVNDDRTNYIKNLKNSLSIMDEYFEDRLLTKNRDKLILLLNELNSKIHNLEGIVSESSTSRSNGWINIPFKSPKTPMIDLYKPHFRMSNQFGELFLNYATTGKSLQQIFKDDDIEHIKNGGLATPQRHISPGIICMFNGQGRWDKNVNCGEEVIIKKFEEWFDKNNLSDYGYKKRDINNCMGYVKVGDFIPLERHTTATCEEIVNYYDKFTIVDNVGVFE